MVFNAALFDFHPETWVMPAFALALWAERNSRPRLWFGLLLLMLGCRDGLVLITAGMAIDLACRRRWRWSLAAGGLSVSWLLMLSRWLYPMLRDGDGPKAASRMFSHLNDDPLTVLSGLDWGGGAEYLLLLCLPCIALWRRASLSTLLIGLPLVLVNLLSASASYRTLVHHYSLPLAVVAVVACIDGLRMQPQSQRGFPWMLCWATGLLAGAGQTLVLHRALPDPSAPAARGQRGTGSDPTEKRRAHHQLPGATVQPAHQHRLPQDQAERTPCNSGVERAVAESQ